MWKGKWMGEKNWLHQYIKIKKVEQIGLNYQNLNTFKCPKRDIILIGNYYHPGQAIPGYEQTLMKISSKVN